MIRTLVAFVVALLACAGCSLGSADDSGEIATGDDETSATVAEAEAEAETEAETGVDADTTDSTPMAGTADDAGPTGPTLSDQPTLEEILAVVEDVHGPTGDVTAEMNRLTRYPEMPTPGGAYVTDIQASATASTIDEGVFDLRSEAFFFADGSVDDLVLFYETQLPALGWSMIGRSTDTRFDGAPRTALDFEITGASFADRQTLTVALVEDPDAPKLIVETVWTSGQIDDPVYFDRLAAWFDGTALPEGGDLRRVNIDTRAGEGRTTVAVEASHRYEGGTEAELLAELADRLTAAGETVVDNSRSNAVTIEHPAVEDYAFWVFESSDSASVSIEAETRFVNVDVDTDVVVAEAKPTDPIPAGASAEQIETVINEIHGPTADIAAQMNRLTPFPSIPTPAGANVVEVTASVDPVIGDDDAVSRFGRAQFRTAGTLEDLVLFFDTQIAGLGWTETGRSEGSDDGGLTSSVTVDYDVTDAVAGDGPTFELVITDDVDRSDVLVEWAYRHREPRAGGAYDLWSGWAGDLPLPDDARQDSIGVTTDLLFGEAIAWFSEYRVERPADEVRADIEAAIGSSDYGPAESTIDSRLALSHPYFIEGYFSITDLTDSTIMTLNVFRPLEG